MKKIVFALLLFSSVGILAQGGERIKALKRAHITDALDLTSAEAEKFWPIYNAHEDKMEDIRKQERRAFMDLRVNGIENLTDDQANTIIDNGLKFKAQELEYLKQLIEKLRSVLPPKKIVRLHRAEEQFKRRMLQMMKDKKGRRGNR
ncbi:hypothetical protein POV27_06105 [Aureisphaera galaxeae]|uniref:hypothetical protein n=1 Tax=Aureisphaera galaxeae TaxID=1538023 RepID=UPI0023502661|nr:hypothetical protein [Aureisphaera galaxeae]MDC8003616.1 hypothetical protein [Aureisphaera galaxeae]